MKKYHQKPEVKEKSKKYQHDYYLKNKDRIDKRTKKWQEENPEKIKNYNRKYHQKPEVKKRAKEYCEIKMKLWKSFSDRKQLKLINKKSKEILKNLK